MLDVICGCAIELAALDDVFKSNECDHHLPENTAQVYQDLGLVSFNPFAVSEKASLFRFLLLRIRRFRHCYHYP